MSEKWNPKIVHIMKDGTVRDSIEGVMIPRDNRYYDVIAGIISSKRELEIKKGFENAAN